MVPTLCDLEVVSEEYGRPVDDEVQELALWTRRDSKSSAIIGLILGSEQLEDVSGSRTTAQFFSTLKGVLQRTSLMKNM